MPSPTQSEFYAGLLPVEPSVEAPQAETVPQNASETIGLAALAAPSFDPQQLNAMSLDLDAVRQSIDRPFARDLLFDPGRRAWPRLAALSVLRSTLCTVSAPATYPLRGSITHPTQPLCTLRGRRRRRLTQHSLPGCLLSITWVGLSPTDRASFAWRLRRVGPQPDIHSFLPNRVR